MLLERTHQMKQGKTMEALWVKHYRLKKFIEESFIPTCLTYNCVIDGFVKEGPVNSALFVYTEINKSGVLSQMYSLITLAWLSGFARTIIWILLCEYICWMRWKTRVLNWMLPCIVLWLMDIAIKETWQV